MSASRLRVIPTYSARKGKANTMSVRLTSGKFEGVSFKIHSITFRGNNLSFQYDFLRIPKAIKKLFLDQPRIVKQFQTVVRNIMYNALILSVRKAKKLLNK
jgi:hypothetical protein